MDETLSLFAASGNALLRPGSSLRLSQLRLKSLTSRDLCLASGSVLRPGSHRSPLSAQPSDSAILFSNGEALHPERTPHGIFVGVSLGGKSPMAEADNIEALLGVLTARGYQAVTFLVADDIARYNYHVFDTCSLTSGAALKAARLEGDRLCALIESVAALWPYMDIKIRRWSDVNTDELQRMVEVLEKVRAVDWLVNWEMLHMNGSSCRASC